MSGDSYFVDTNVFLYKIDTRSQIKQRQCDDWLTWLWVHGLGRTSWQVVYEFNANAVRKIGAPVPDVRKIVRDLVEWKPVAPDFSLIERAWHWTDTAQVPSWDALILASAERLDCRCLLSEDFQADREYGSIRVVSPFQLGPPVLA